MNGAAKPGVLMPAYDAQELRRRMPLCFTIGELYRFAAKLQVPETPAWSNNPQEAARDIVRHFERSGALAFLVEALREAKPLVEWPEPLALAIPPAPPAAPLAAPAQAGATQLAAPISQAFDTADTSVDPPPNFPSDRPTPISTVSAAALLANHDARTDGAPGFAPAVMHRPGEVPAAPAARATGPDAPTPHATIPDPFASAAAPTIDSPPASVAPSSKATIKPGVGSAPWPGTARAKPASPARTGIDPKLLVGGGAGILVVAIAIAFFVGRASSSSAAPETGTSGATADLPKDHVAIAEHAAAAMGASLERVARSCQIEVSSLRGRSLFEVAYRRCGPLPRPTGEPRQASLDPEPDPNPNATPDPADSPDTDPRPKKTGGGNKLQKVATPNAPSGGGGSVCLSNCSKSHAACTPRCGPEPQQGSQYDAYQSCLGGCLKALSQCKMGCQ